MEKYFEQKQINRQDTKVSPKYFILSPSYSLRGWRLLPYALQNLRTANTEFFLKEEFELLKACDGHTEIHWSDLTDDERKKYGHWRKNGIITACGEGAKLHPEQEYRFYPSRFKERVQWSVTGRCNYRCRHCFMSAPHAAQGEPSFDELMTMLDAFEHCGIKAVNLTGGEPLVRSDFWELVDEILSRKILIPVIFTNGALVTEAFLDKLMDRGMRPSLQLSFDGAGWHDWMRGIKGAEQTALKVFQMCRERHIPTSVSMTLFRENIGSLRETVNLLASYGVRSLKTGIATEAGEWLDQPEHYLTREELYEGYLAYIPEFFEDGCPMTLALDGFFDYDKFEGRYGSFQEKDIKEEKFSKTLMCGHVRRELYVSPKGNVLPCMSMVGTPIEESFPNMLEVPLDEILDSGSFYMDIVNLRVSDYMEHHPECKSCDYRTLCCGGCRALAIQNGQKDYLGIDPAACAYFKDGWMERKNELLRSLGK